MAYKVQKANNKIKFKNIKAEIQKLLKYNRIEAL